MAESAGLNPSLSLETGAIPALNPELSMSSLSTPTRNPQASLNSAVRSASEGYAQPELAAPREDDGGRKQQQQQLQEVDELANGADGNREGSAGSSLDSLEDGADSSTFDDVELDLIENALRGLLGKMQTPAPGQQQQDNHEFLNGHSSSRELMDEDVVERLLKKVEVAKEDSRSRGTISRSRSQSSGEGEETGSKSIRHVAEASSRAAMAAATAAEKVADMVEKNTIAIGNLYSTRGKSTPDELHLIEEEDGEEQRQGQNAEAGEKESSKKYLSNLLRQNTITHLILGVMFVTSMWWRWTVYQAGKSVSDTMTDPFGSLTDMFKDQDGSSSDEGYKLRLPFGGPPDDVEEAKKRINKETQQRKQRG